MNQNPKQTVRDNTRAAQISSCWLVQDKLKINQNTGIGVAIREYQAGAGPAGYVLFANKKPLISLKQNGKKRQRA